MGAALKFSQIDPPKQKGEQNNVVIQQEFLRLNLNGRSKDSFYKCLPENSDLPDVADVVSCFLEGGGAGRH